MTSAGHKSTDRDRAESVAAHPSSENIEIAPEEWLTFLDSFSRQHEGWLASITLTQGGETKTEVRDCRLNGVSSDHPNARDEIYISFDHDHCGHLAHGVKNPVKVVFRRDLEGAHQGMDIISADGTLTSIRFRIAARPETLDGIVADI